MPVKKQVIGLCRLCQKTGPLRDSHITPAFVSRWVKKTSASPYLRSPLTPNVPKQDTNTVPLLCADCEERFSKWEKIFAEKIFIPYHDHHQREFAYDKWLLNFAVSLSWRSVAKETTILREEYPQMAPRIEPVLDRWAEFLLERAKDPGPCDHHVIFWDPQTMRISGDEGKLPEKFFWYVMRHMDSTTVFSEKTNVIYAYSKLPHIFFWSGIDPTRPEGLRGTLIKKKGKIGLNQIIKNEDFTHFIANRVRESRRYMASMSERQKEKIVEMTLANPDKTINSKSFQAFLAEQAYRRSQK